MVKTGEKSCLILLNTCYRCLGESIERHPLELRIRQHLSKIQLDKAPESQEVSNS